MKSEPKAYPIKLVRDGTPDIVNASGKPGSLLFAGASPSARHALLQKKLMEEVAEYLVDGGVDELRDVLFVVAQLARSRHHVSLGELVNSMGADPRGGFSRFIVMVGLHGEYDREEGGADGDG